MLALQWAVVALLDIGARLLNYRIAVRSYRETLPLLGGETPMAASMAVMGRYMTRWLQRSYAGARRHLSRTLRTLAHSLFVSSAYLLLAWTSRRLQNAEGTEGGSEQRISRHGVG